MRIQDSIHIKLMGCGKFQVIHYKHVTNGSDPNNSAVGLGRHPGRLYHV